MSPNLAPSPLQTPSLDTLLSRAAWRSLPDKAWLRVTGPDAVRWLNGMLTNSIQALTPGRGCYNFVLNAQGKIQGDCTVFAHPTPDPQGQLLLQTDTAQLATLRAWFDRFIIMDDVELAPVEPTWQGLEFAGPDAAALLGLTSPPAPLTLQPITLQGHAVTLLAAHAPLVPRYELWAAPTTLAVLSQALPLNQAPPEIFEQLRILEGTPRFGHDIRDRELPQETAPTGTPSRALHFSKGCYLGQEIVERIHSRGNLHRTFAGFTLSGPTLPAPATPLTQAGKAVGELTSTTRLTLNHAEHILALGYIRREALENKQAILDSPEGAQATPVPLPFRLS